MTTSIHLTARLLEFHLRARLLDLKFYYAVVQKVWILEVERFFNTKGNEGSASDKIGEVVIAFFKKF